MVGGARWHGVKVFPLAMPMCMRRLQIPARCMPNMGMRAPVGSAFLLDTMRSGLHAWKPFLSILIITMLGVAVLTGIYAGCRDTFAAANRFYRAQGLHDVQVISTMGLTDADVDALRQVEGVEQAQGMRMIRVKVADGDGKQLNATLEEPGKWLASRLGQALCERGVAAEQAR